MKIALTTDYLNQYGGAERTIEAIHQVWPEAPIFTSVYEKEEMARLGFDTKTTRVVTSFVQHLPLRKILPRYYFTLFYPFAFQSFNLGEYDVILTTSSYAAKDIRKPKGSLHLAYIHTPPRFLYGFDQETSVDRMNPLEKFLAGVWKIYLRYRDQRSVRGIDCIFSNSKNVQARVKKIYGRDSDVLYPPVETARFSGTPTDGGYWIVVSRLGEYKKIDLVVKAFNELGLPLKVVGSGPQLEYLQQIAKDNVEILGRKGDGETQELLLNARAFIFPTDEDFGIAPLEAMAAGKSVLAYGKGGSLETILPGKTGEFFAEQSVEEIKKAVHNFEPSRYSSEACRARAGEFDIEVFKKRVRSLVEEAVSGRISKEG